MMLIGAADVVQTVQEPTSVLMALIALAGTLGGGLMWAFKAVRSDAKQTQRCYIEEREKDRQAMEAARDSWKRNIEEERNERTRDRRAHLRALAHVIRDCRWRPGQNGESATIEAIVEDLDDPTSDNGDGTQKRRARKGAE